MRASNSIHSVEGDWSWEGFAMFNLACCSSPSWSSITLQQTALTIEFRSLSPTTCRPAIAPYATRLTGAHTTFGEGSTARLFSYFSHTSMFSVRDNIFTLQRGNACSGNAIFDLVAKHITRWTLRQRLLPVSWSVFRLLSLRPSKVEFPKERSDAWSMF